MKIDTEYDAIVIGSGISGGWAAKELCDKGLRTLVLERGRDVKHIQDYPTMSNPSWEFALRGSISRQQRSQNPLISKAAGYDATIAHFFVKDADHPYMQEKPFEWIRGYQVGGKSLTWGRACARCIDLQARKHAEVPDQPVPHYFTLMKQLPLLGFFTSEPGSTRVLRYRPVPGKYKGCVPYKKGEASWA